MMTYTELEGLVSEEELQLFERVKSAFVKLPNFPFTVTCHQLALAFSKAIPELSYCEGYFLSSGWTHSWVTTPGGNIIDVYPWATVGGPIFLCTAYFSPWKRIFILGVLNHEGEDMCQLMMVEEVVKALCG